jgi:hypothetical protein
VDRDDSLPEWEKAREMARLELEEVEG